MVIRRPAATKTDHPPLDCGVTRKQKMPQLDRETQKQVLKEAIQEWLDAQFAAFGRWTFYGLLAAAFAGAIILMLKGQGWNKP